MATITETGICNLALTQLGAATISDIDGSDKHSLACAAVFDHIRDVTLEDHPWSFAQERVALTDSGSDPTWTDDLMTEKYNKPTDLLKVNFANQENALVKVEGDYILSDTASLKIKYTKQITDTTKFTSGFIMAFAHRLAASISYRVTGKQNLAESLLTVYFEKTLPQAISVDSQQSAPLQPVQNEWLIAREMASSPLIGRQGFNTWFPVNSY